jgi:Arc/MetJ-type ribon-helix-helix transcriptional regulator
MSEYDQRPDHGRAPLPTTRDALAPYLSTTEAGPFTKLSISLPEPLISAVREVSDSTGVSVSGVIAASLRRLLDEVEQARLDRALEEDREENLAWARAVAHGDALLMRDIEW